MAEIPSAELDQAADLLEKGEVDRAIGAFQRYIRATPDSFRAHLKLGQAYGRKRREGAQFTRLAERELAEAMRLVPPEQSGHNVLCQLARTLGRTERLKEEYRGAFKELPFARECLANLEESVPAGPGVMATLASVVAGKRRLLGIVVLIATAFFLIRGFPGGRGGATGAGKGGAVAGSRAAEFALQDLSGETVSLASFRGRKGVLLDFWATWCPPCRASLPAISSIKQTYGDRVEVLSLNQGETADKAREFLASQGLALHVLLDSDGAVARAYSVRGIPTFVVIDREGVIRGVFVGWGGDSTASELVALVTGL